MESNGHGQQQTHDSSKNDVKSYPCTNNRTCELLVPNTAFTDRERQVTSRVTVLTCTAISGPKMLSYSHDGVAPNERCGRYESFENEKQFYLWQTLHNRYWRWILRQEILCKRSPVLPVLEVPSSWSSTYFREYLPRGIKQGQYLPGPETSFARILRGADFFLWHFNYALQNFQWIESNLIPIKIIKWDCFHTPA